MGLPSDDRSHSIEKASRSERRELVVAIGVLVLRRLAFGAAVLLAVIFLSYLGLSIARGDAFYPALGAAVSETVEYVGRLARGELGRSAAASITQASVTVADVLPGIVKKSLGLLAVSLAFATLVAVPLGVWAATRRRSGAALMSTLVSIVGVSVPSFFAALLLQLGAIRMTRVLGSVSYTHLRAHET